MLEGERRRLLASWAVAVGIGFMAGPFCALAHLLQNNDPTVFFSPARYLYLNTAVCLAITIAAAILATMLFTLTSLWWRRQDDARSVVGMMLPLLILAVFAAYQKGKFMLPVTAFAVGLEGPLTEVTVGVALAWAVLWLFFDNRSVQIAAVPVLCLYPLLKLAGLAAVMPFAFATIVLILALRRYEDNINHIFAETISMIVFVAVPLVAVLHVRAGHYVFALDAPYSLAFIGIFALVIVLLLLLRNIARHSSLTAPACGALISCAVIAAGIVWWQGPVKAPDNYIRSHDRPNISLIVWDTARAQQLGEYGGRQGLTPTFSGLAEQGVLFEHAVATSCWTLPTHGSMFTGLWPRTHAASSGGFQKLGSEPATLAELLSDAGYLTVGLTGNHSWASRAAGIAQGFDIFYDPVASAELAALPIKYYRKLFHPYDLEGMALLRGVRRWMFVQKQIDKPFFLFVNLYEPHDPYTPRRELTKMTSGVPFDEAFQWNFASGREHWLSPPDELDDPQRVWEAYRDLYAGDIRYTDRVTGRLLQLLNVGPTGETNAMTIVTGDHGENLGEHDMPDHIFSLHETLVHVPLVVHWPPQLARGARIDDTVSQRRLFATIADAAGLDKTVWSSRNCTSLLSACKKGQVIEPERVFAEAWPLPSALYGIVSRQPRGAPLGRFISPLFATYDGKYKYIRAAGQQRQALFNLAQDPQEQQNIAADHPTRCREMSQCIKEWLEDTPNNMPAFTDGYEVEPLTD